MGDHVRGPQKTEGSVALAKCGESPEQIARRSGAKYSVVVNWLDGYRRPGTAWRARLEDLYQIPTDAWSKPIEFTPAGSPLLANLPAPVAQLDRAPAPSAGQDAGSMPAGGSDLAARLRGQVEAFMGKVETDPLLTLSEKAKVLAAAGRTVHLLVRITGEAADIPESKILKTPGWGRIQAALVAALEPWPEALRAAGEALVRLGGT